LGPQTGDIVPVFLFKGRVLPEFVDLNVWKAPSVHFFEPPYPPELPNGLTIDYSIAINHSIISLICTVEQSPVESSWIYNRAVGLVRALVDLHSFATGTPLAVILDTVIGPDGVENKILLTNPQVAGICGITVPDASKPGAFGFGDSLEILFREPELFLALRDLISGITYPNCAAVDCARAVDGLRIIMCPDPNDKKTGWEMLQSNLQLTKDY
jgi:hypothetical protein